MERSGAEWSGVERSGAKWSGVDRSGAGRRIDLLGGDPKKHDQSSYFKSIKGQSLESNIAAALVLELHHPIMSKLWGLVDQTHNGSKISWGMGGGGVPGSQRLQWSGVEWVGGFTHRAGTLKSMTTVVTLNLLRDRV